MIALFFDTAFCKNNLLGCLYLHFPLDSVSVSVKIILMKCSESMVYVLMSTALGDGYKSWSSYYSSHFSRWILGVKGLKSKWSCACTLTWQLLPESSTQREWCQVRNVVVSQPTQQVSMVSSRDTEKKGAVAICAHCWPQKAAIGGLTGMEGWWICQGLESSDILFNSIWQGQETGQCPKLLLLFAALDLEPS